MEYVESRHRAHLDAGNIGTDLMIKILRHGQHLEVGAMVGIDPASDGLARAERMGVVTTHEGVTGLVKLPAFADIDIIFDATSAGAHVENDAFLREHKPGIRMIDLTPAAIGPYCVPVVNGAAHLDAPNVNMVTCGGQATIPMVRPSERVATGVLRRDRRLDFEQECRPRHARQHRRVHRDHLASAIEVVGGAKKGKAIIVLNPAEPPLIMRDTVYTCQRSG
jgi:acetaldehyde dehydrogenase